MSKKTVQNPEGTESLWWVPMAWKHRGGMFVNAETAEAATENAKKLDGELHEAGAELVDWEVIGKPEKQS